MPRKMSVVWSLQQQNTPFIYFECLEIPILPPLIYPRRFLLCLINVRVRAEKRTAAI